MKLQVGLIGISADWRSRHLPALQALGDRLEVVAVCDEVAHRAREAAQFLGATTVDGFRALIRFGEIDTIMYLSPQWYGVLPTLAACEMGKAIYCAPIADMSPTQVMQVRQVVEQSGTAFMAEFPLRHMPVTIRLKELIATRLGRPRLLFCHHRLPIESLPGPHYPPRENGILSRLLELTDWCRYVVGSNPGSVVSASHVCPESHAQVEDYRMINLSFPGENCETMAQVSCGRYMPIAWSEARSFRPPAALQVRCERGIAYIDPPTSLVWFDDAGRHMESLESDTPVGEVLLSQFYRMATSLVRRTDSLEDIQIAVAMMEAARTSAREGHRVDITDFQ